MDPEAKSAAWPELTSLERFARLAALVAGAPAAVINLGPGYGSARASYGVDPAIAMQQRCPAIKLIGTDGVKLGTVELLADAAQPAPTPDCMAALHELAAVIVRDLERERRDADLMQVMQLADRAERILHMVSEAGSCADALTSMLQELCQYHGAAIGRVWRLSLPEDVMHEVGRFGDDVLEAGSHGRNPSIAPLKSGGSLTAKAIRRNEPLGATGSAVAEPGRYASLAAAIEAGLQSQVSFPIWVQEERFGLALGFRTERTDLGAIIDDIALLANTVRPVLFRKVTEERIRLVTHHGDLAQLANRLVFQECLDNAVRTAARGEHGLALLHLDLDGVRSVNDKRGREIGDQLLAAVAARLRESVREGDTVARMGGDEFAVVQTLGGQPDAATKLAQRLLDRVGEPYEIDEQRSIISASIGISIFPVDGDNPGALLRNADTAMYRAKEAGRNTFRLFESSMDLRQQERLLIERDLGDAVSRQNFTLAYQPICDARSLEIVGYEALLRWNHPTRGPIQPDQFVPLAEESGLILPLGQWALEAACTEAASWPYPHRLSVNLSPLQFRQQRLPEMVADILDRTGFPASRLDLEVTEGLLLDDTGLVQRTMEALKRQGISITLDDFGTAYASLSYLRRFPFDRIKIDKTFIQPICDDDSTLAIVQTILALSARLRLTVVAEGVETDEQLDLLRRLGCPFIQGFRTGGPLERHDLRASFGQDGLMAREEADAASLISR